MGDFLTKPITEKNATDDKNDKLMYGACSMQGWRKSNEDAHIHNMDLGDGNSLFVCDKIRLNKLAITSR